MKLAKTGTAANRTSQPLEITAKWIWI